MDNTPQTRSEKHKDRRTKNSGNTGKYSQQHIRRVEALLEARAEKGSNNEKTSKKKGSKK